MAKNIAPIKSTSGAGYSFEEMVGAHYLALMLAGASPLAPKQASIVSIDFQVRVDGWLLDDLLVTMQVSGEIQRISISIKSNAQLSESSVPADFVEACWEQYFGVNNCPFQRERDLMGLVTGPQPGSAFQDAQKLLTKVREQSPPDFPRRLATPKYASAAERSLFLSFSCPPRLSSLGPSDEVASAALLRHVLILQFDYENQPSENLQRSHQLCQGIVASGKQEDAIQLWDRLLAVSRQQRQSNGKIDLAKLLREIRPAPQLLAHPSCRDPWRLLRSWSGEQISNVPTKIGGKVAIDRSDLLSQIAAATQQNSLIVLIGNSGSGKSVVARQWAESVAPESTVIWVPSAVLAGGNLDAYRQRVGITETLDRVIPFAPNCPAYAVIDGIDRIANADGASSLANLLRLLQVVDRNSLWRVVATCQAEHWDRIQALLALAGVQPASQIVEVDLPADEQLKPVWKTFPALNFVRSNAHLGELVRNPKVLDILARGCEQAGFDSDSRRWIGESDVIKWYWETVIGASAEPLGRKSLLMKLGESQANSGSSETPLPDVTSGPPLESLTADNILKVIEERVSFAHDILGDWARQRSILARGNDVAAYLAPKILLPYWHRAIRLYGTHLLEQSSELQDWQKVMAEVPAATDCLLDAVIFSSNAAGNLERMWPLLIANEGELLRRLLNRFHHMATFPNPLITASSSEDTDAALAMRVAFRVPYGPYWYAMIRFLDLHRVDAVAVAKTEISRLLNTLLRYSPPKVGIRKEAAALALAIADKHLADRDDHSYDSDEDARLPFEAGLAAAYDLPDQTAAFALKAAGRIKPDSQYFTRKRYIAPGAMVDSRSIIAGGQRPQPEPWPDGPFFRVDEAFQATVLSPAALVPLFETRPEAAGEVILACLIEERNPHRDEVEFSSLSRRDMGFNFFRMHPPFYWQGPFLLFLQFSPEIAIRMISRLTQYATNRWADGCRIRNYEQTTVTIRFPDRETAFLGDYDVLYWYAGSPYIADAVVSALMALEKWLYDLQDTKKSVVDWCSQLLKDSSSVAVLGLLLEIGRRDESLFKGPLQPLLAVPELTSWEMKGMLSNVHSLKTIGMALSGRRYVEAVIAWNAMPHRKLSVVETAQRLFLFDSSTKDFFANARMNLEERFKREPAGSEYFDILVNLLAWFDPANWKETEYEGRRAIRFQPPNHMVERAKAYEESTADSNLVLVLPSQCRQRIDKRQPIPDEELESYWKTMETAATIMHRQPTDSRSVAAFCGCLAVIFVFHREWLRSNPEREAWAFKEIKQVFRYPPPREQMDSPTMLGNCDWDDFCAEIIPIIWAETPSSQLVRKMIAQLVTAFHYRAVGRLCKSASEVREKLGKSFGQLWNLIIRWAVLRERLEDPNRQSEAKADYDKWRRKYGVAFIKGTISDALPKWDDAIGAPGRLSVLNRHGRPKSLGRTMLIDRDLLMHAFDWLPGVDLAKTSRERSAWVGFWREAYGSSMQLLRSYSEEGEEIEDNEGNRGAPYDFDRWILERAARMIPDLDDAETPSDFWRPLFVYGWTASDWIEDFLFEWFRKNLERSDKTRFLARWKEMISFARQTAAWNANKWVCDDIWCDLLGFGRFIRRLWEPSDGVLISQMTDEYANWAKIGLKSASSAAQFVDWLSNPAAAILRLPGLIWLKDANLDVSGDDRDDNRFKESLVKFLFGCWKNQWNEVRARPDSLAAFHALLQNLAQAQFPSAMELQQLIAQG